MRLGWSILFPVFAVLILVSRVAHSENVPMRIVSLAPGITETLYALGLGDRIVGNTQFCNWPPEAAQKPRVAGFRDINLEAVIRTMPDLVLLPDDMAHYKNQLEQVGLKVMLFDNRTLKGFLEDLVKLGKICAREEQAQKFVAAFTDIIEEQDQVDEEKAPKILFALMNPDDCVRPVTELTILGNEGFYNELVEAAGGRNAYTGKVPYPRISGEALFNLHPDLIAVAAPECPQKELMVKNWQKIPGLGKAAESLLVLDDTGDTIPGPRALGTLGKLAKAVSAWKDRRQWGE